MTKGGTFVQWDVTQQRRNDRRPHDADETYTHSVDQQKPGTQAITWYESIYGTLSCSAGPSAPHPGLRRAWAPAQKSSDFST